MENEELGCAIRTAVETEIASDCATDIAPVVKSTANVTESVFVPSDVAETAPASEDTVTFVAAAALWENVMYSVLPR